MELTKKVKNYGNMKVITLNKEDREKLQIEEGDYLHIEIHAIYKQGIGLPKPPEIHPDAEA